MSHIIGKVFLVVGLWVVGTLISMMLVRKPSKDTQSDMVDWIFSLLISIGISSVFSLFSADWLFW